jgi:hypothetical protein
LQLHQLQDALEIDCAGVAAKIGGGDLRLKPAGGTHNVSAGAQMEATGICDGDHHALALGMDAGLDFGPDVTALAVER